MHQSMRGTAFQLSAQRGVNSATDQTSLMKAATVWIKAVLIKTSDLRLIG